MPIISTNSCPNSINLDILLPNGLLVNLQLKSSLTLEEVRHQVWQEASKISKIDPCLSLRNSIKDYIFTSVTREAVVQEFYDYTKRLCDLKLFQYFFQLVETSGNIEEKLYNSELSKAVGLYVTELDKINNQELIEFRQELFKEVLLGHQENKNMIQNFYSPNLEINPSMLDFSLSSRINMIQLEEFDQATVDMCILVTETDRHETKYHLNVPLNYSPSDLISLMIVKKMEKSEHSDELIQSIVEKYKDSYVLQICGCDEIIFGSEHKIGSYKYVKRCISAESKPHFNLMSMEKLNTKIHEDNIFYVNLLTRYLVDTENKFGSSELSEGGNISWNMNESFNVYLENLTYLPFIKECEKIYIKFSIYHALDMKYETESERFDFAKIAGKDSSLRLHKFIPFDYKIRKLHRCDRLNISIHCVTRRKREFFSIGFISLNLFDFRAELISGRKKLYLWPASQDSPGQLVSGVTGQNTDKDFVRLSLEFLRNKSLENKIFYPSTQFIKNLLCKKSNNTMDECIDVTYALENDNNLLDTILNKDSLAELTEQEKNVLWKRRDDCLNYPHSLPKLLQAVNWSNKADILEMYCLLFKWPLIKPMQAMELLSSVYADLEVRRYACKSLEKYMKDEEIEYYLLQLVQALKNEPYCDNSLSRFLLKRAIKNQRIGFILFWSLRSEITKPKYKFKFGLLLEAFCRSLNKAQLKSVIKQIEVVEKLSNLAHEIKSNPNNLTLIRSSFLSDTLLKPENRLNLSNFISPLNQSILLGLLEAKKCKILASAKRPLLLTWTNEIKYSEFYDKSFQLIFKKGDDLRQDMLTIQALRLMDILWKNEGLDLKMLIYDCFSTGYKTGFIQVIKNSMTLFKIQMKGGMKSTYQIDTLQLYKWIAAHNTDSGQLDKAIELFTRSCAGFCVATFILGIADRHPDNIMVNRKGQIFHIDFGHFLGHFKKKYGIKRERVPFVLTEDFTRVIAKGSVNSSESAEFNRFKNLCELAYMTIRKYSHLIINLFTMMLSSDMTELQSIEDILFLRKTLAIDEPYDKALEFFRNQFNEAYRRSFTTKIDWMCHALNKKNFI